MTPPSTPRPPGGPLPWPDRRHELRALAAVFARLGLVAFGGPAGHIAMMEDEVVRRRQWLNRSEFLDLIGATNLIPGPNSTEMAIHIGLARAGRLGMVVAGACFILPAVLLVGVLAAIYVRVGSLPAATRLLHGVQPVIIAIVAHALVGLARTAVTSGRTAAAGALALAMGMAGVGEIRILAVTAIVMAAISRGHGRAAAERSAQLVSGAGASGAGALGAGPVSAGTAGTAGAAALGAGVSVAAALPYSAATLFLTFLKTGSVLFGSGYVLIAFLRADFVGRLGWLSERQLLDAVAIGQVTPGPVFSTATFVGYLAGGPVGAVLATVGIFLPAFVFVALSGRVLPRLQRSPLARPALDGVNVASLALMANALWVLSRHSVTSWTAAALALASVAVLATHRVNPTWLVLGGALLGSLGVVG